jgi:hypothetical protein
MNKVERLNTLLDEVSSFENPEDIINKTLERIGSLAKEYRVKVGPTLDDIKGRLLQYVKTKGKCPTKSGSSMQGCKYVGEASMGLFHDRLKETIRAYISLLNKAKTKNPWMDIKALVEPLTSLETEESYSESFENPRKIVEMTMEKIRTLAAKNRVAVGGIADIEKKLLNYVDSRGSEIITYSKFPARESVQQFKDAFFQTIKTYTQLLNRAKETNPWINVRSMVEPLAHLEAKDIEKQKWKTKTVAAKIPVRI